MTIADDLGSLLDVAREVLRTDLQPALPAPLRYPAAMAANAMAIAARAFAFGAEGEARQRATLAALYDLPPDTPLDQLERRLARELRLTRPDPGREERIRAALLARVLARLEISNPGYPATYS
jgi:hypothetical protein